jgi:hypothetical protein
VDYTELRLTASLTKKGCYYISVVQEKYKIRSTVFAEYCHFHAMIKSENHQKKSQDVSLSLSLSLSLCVSFSPVGSASLIRTLPELCTSWPKVARIPQPSGYRMRTVTGYDAELFRQISWGQGFQKAFPLHKYLCRLLAPTV